MSNLNVKTSFNVLLNLEQASVSNRMGAYILDFICIAVYSILMLYFLSVFNLGDLSMSDTERVNWGIISLVSLPIMFYTLISEFVSGGYTLGKYLMNIKVVKLDGLQAGFVEYFIRWIFRIIDIYFFIIIGLIWDNDLITVFSLMMIGLVGMITIATQNNQRIGDMVAGTAVIKTKIKKDISITIIDEIADTYIPQYPMVVKLSDNDVRIIKDNFEKSTKHENWELTYAIVERIENVLQLKYEGNSPKEFIETIISDYNYYTRDM